MRKAIYSFCVITFWFQITILTHRPRQAKAPRRSVEKLLPGQEASFNVSALALDCAHKKVKKGYHAADSSVTLYYSAPTQAVSHPPHSPQAHRLAKHPPNTPLPFASVSLSNHTLKSVRDIRGFGRKHSTNLGGGDQTDPKYPAAMKAGLMKAGLVGSDGDASSLRDDGAPDPADLELVAKPGVKLGASEERI